jgi:hypothetical protein
LSSWWDNGSWSDIRTALKLPAAGRRYSATTLSNLGSGGRYWSSAAHASLTSNSRLLYFYSSSVFPGISDYRRLGYSVRCFKD